MTLKGMVDRKLVMLVAAPLLRRLGTALAVYLASKGAPADLLDQLLQALGIVAGLVFDITLAANDKRKAENAGMRKALDILGKGNADDAFYQEAR